MHVVCSQRYHPYTRVHTRKTKQGDNRFADCCDHCLRVFVCVLVCACDGTQQLKINVIPASTIELQRLSKINCVLATLLDYPRSPPLPQAPLFFHNRVPTVVC